MNNSKTDDQEIRKSLKAEYIGKDQIEMLVRNAALTQEIPADIAIDIAKLLFTTVALSKGDATAHIRFKIHDTDETDGILRQHGKHGFCLACIKIETKFGHKCISIAPGVPTPCCLLPDSRIRLENGETCSINDLETGHRILAYDVRTGRTISTGVTLIIKNHIREGFYTVNDVLSATNDHPVLVNENGKESWVRMENLATGHFIRAAEGLIPVETIRRTEKQTPTVYMETEAGNFIVDTSLGGFVVSGNYMQLEFQQGELAGGAEAEVHSA